MSGDAHRQVLEDLRSSDEEIRRLAVERMSALPSGDAIPLLVESLGDLSWRVRKAAVERLVGSSEGAAVADALVAALGDGDNPGRRNSAVEALMACGSAVVPRLLDALATDDIDVRKLVVDALAGIADARACEPMIRTLGDPDANVRAAAADAIGVLGGEEGARALAEVAVDPDQDQLVRFSALRALVRLEHPIASNTLAPVLDDPVLRPAAFGLLGFSEDPGAEDLLRKGLSSSGRAPREAAMEALLGRVSRAQPADAERLAQRIREAAASTPGLLDAAIERLGEADLGTRLMLVQFLGLVGSAECVVPVLECARDEAVAEIAFGLLEAIGEVAERELDRSWPNLDRDLRQSACSLLARTDARHADTRLTEALDDPDAELRAAAARALGSRRSAGALEKLVVRLECASLDEEPEAEEEQAALIDALIALGEEVALVPRILDELGPRFESPDEPIRRSAAAVLARLARPEDADRSTALLKDPSAGVRRLAVGGLVRLDPAVAAEPLRLALADESPLVRREAAFTLASSRSPEALEDLQRLLVDEDVHVCAAALRSIGSYCGGERACAAEERERALDLLRDFLAEPQRGGVVMVAAIEALDAIGGERAASVALAGLGSDAPEVVQAAVVCVGRHGDADTLSELVGLVQHPSWVVRGETIQTLADRGVARALPAILRRLETEQDSFVRDVIVRALQRLEA